MPHSFHIAKLAGRPIAGIRTLAALTSVAAVLGMLAPVGLLVPAPASADGLPENARQVASGYWIGAEPELDDVAALADAGFERVVSLELIETEVVDAIEEAGMTRINLRFGKNFPDADELERALGDVPPEQVYIHCEHGGDRTGAVAAYLLVTRERWPVSQAFVSVMIPNPRDIGRLVPLLAELGHPLVEGEIAAYGAVFSGRNNGGIGGLKIRSDDYRTLIRTTVGAIESRHTDTALAPADDVVVAPNVAR